MNAFKKGLAVFITLALLAAGGIYARYKFLMPPPQAAVDAAAARAPVGIAIYRALYTFNLISADPGAGLSGVDGKMYFEQDDACDAWTTDRRLTTEYRYDEHGTDKNDSHYTAFESKDGRQFSFSSERQEGGDDSEPELLRGSVSRNADSSAEAIYSRPDDITYDLPKGFLLPTMHTVEVIRHARAGDRFFTSTVFDGTDEDGPVEIGTFIGKKATADEIKKISARKQVDRKLLTKEAWHIRMALFPLKDKIEMTPAYEMELIMHDNGVVSDAVVDYKIFRVEQKLTALENLPSKKCR